MKRLERGFSIAILATIMVIWMTIGMLGWLITGPILLMRRGKT